MLADARRRSGGTRIRRIPVSVERQVDGASLGRYSVQLDVAVVSSSVENCTATHVNFVISISTYYSAPMLINR